MYSPHTCTLTLALAVLALPRTANAGPTVGADLDLGTSTYHASPSSPVPYGVGYLPSSPLYLVGFAIRAGWRFDLRPVFFLPEIGAGYAVERFSPVEGVTGNASGHIARVFGGGRFGGSGALGPALRLEPAIFGHAGAGWYGAATSGTAFDVGLALDLRILGHFIVGAQVAYDVVTVWHPAVTPRPGSGTGNGCVEIPTGPTCPPSSPSAPPQADPWVSYGIHAAYLFW